MFRNISQQLMAVNISKENMNYQLDSPCLKYPHNYGKLEDVSDLYSNITGDWSESPILNQHLQMLAV
jgi:hypothetical protein